MKTLASLSIIGALFVASGCTSPCDDAAEVLTRQCFMEVGGETDMQCEGQRLAYSECILNYPQDACDWYYDPVVADGNAFDLCVRAIPPDP